MSSASRMTTIPLSNLKLIKSGIYILEMSSSSPVKVEIKKFDSILPGNSFYYYAGSAQKNLYHRVIRHFKKEKKVHWHIDNLTTNENISIISALILQDASREMEWLTAVDLENHFNCEIPLAGFGNSDTKMTKSHLFSRKSRISYNHFFSRYHSMVRFIPSSIETS